jgi:hypothetical protein
MVNNWLIFRCYISPLKNNSRVGGPEAASRLLAHQRTVHTIRHRRISGATADRTPVAKV